MDYLKDAPELDSLVISRLLSARTDAYWKSINELLKELYPGLNPREQAIIFYSNLIWSYIEAEYENFQNVQDVTKRTSILTSLKDESDFIVGCISRLTRVMTGKIKDKNVELLWNEYYITSIEKYARALDAIWIASKNNEVPENPDEFLSKYSPTSGVTVLAMSIYPLLVSTVSLGQDTSVYPISGGWDASILSQYYKLMNETVEPMLRIAASTLILKSDPQNQ